jgi:hypothetical protein
MPVVTVLADNTKTAVIRNICKYYDKNYNNDIVTKGNKKLFSLYPPYLSYN